MPPGLENEFLPPDVVYRDKFEAWGTSRLLNSSFRLRLTARNESASLEPKQVREIENRHLKLALHKFQFNSPAASCAALDGQVFGAHLLSIQFEGLYRSAMVTAMQQLIESGIFPWWDHMFWTQLQGEYKRSDAVQAQETTSRLNPKPVAMDFEIMQIFPFSGYLLGCATVVFLLEWIHAWIQMWRTLDALLSSTCLAG